jgi:predicted CxxxxCH...CXXCH cytochrome family protein
MLAILSGTAIFIILSGCQTKVNDTWQGFTGFHPFPAPYAENHASYLRTNDFPLEVCQKCHGTDFNTVINDTSCTDCHTHASGPGACNSCHGNFSADSINAANQAPPADVNRDTASAEVGVGAHQAHLMEGLLANAFSCSECHTVPSSWSSVGHIDPSPAELTWGNLATQDSLTPQWDSTTATCSNTYCHLNASPIWTQVDGSQAQCGSCHALPPPPPHTTSTACQACHGEVVDASYDIIDKSKHVDGIVEVQGHPFGEPYVANHAGYLRDNLFPMELCQSCHGSNYGGGTSGVSCLACHANLGGPEACNTCHGNFSGNPSLPPNQAPPVDIARNSSTTEITVGAHQSHLTDGLYTDAFSCTECHAVPTGVNSGGHIDTAPSELTWGPLATHDSHTPQWNRSNGTCSSAYCHLSATPVWNQVGSGQAACGTCHDLPPPPPHSTSTSCYACHGQVVDSTMTIIDKTRHVDGTVDVQIQHPFGEPYVANHAGYLRTNLYPLENCQLCHGSDYSGGSSGASCLGCHTNTGGPEACNTCHGNFSGNPSLPVDIAPPNDVVGNSSTDSIGVGAHRSHIVGRSYTDGVDCISCHVIPAHWNSSGHIGPPPAEVIFSGLALIGGANPVWNRQSRNCNDTYCHRPGVPVWTIVNGTQAACGHCHSIPPPPPHENETECSECHGMVINSAGVIIRPDLHLNGIINVNE